MAFVIHTLPTEKFEALSDYLEDCYTVEYSCLVDDEGVELRSYEVRRGSAQISVDEFPKEEGDDHERVNIFIRSARFNPLRFRFDAKLYKDFLRDMNEHGLEEYSVDKLQ